MSKHTTISSQEAADRLAIRELVEAYAHCADRRDAKRQMSLFTEDTHFVVYMNSKDQKPSQELALARGTRSCLCRPEQVRRHNAFHWTEHTLHAGGRPRNRRSLLPRTSRHSRQRKETLDGRLAPILRHLREDRWLLVLCRAPAVRRLAGGAALVVTVRTEDRPVLPFLEYAPHRPID